MKTKLELAHEYAMLHMMNPQYKDVDDLEVVQWAWDYVEAMQAEAEKRKDTSRPDVLAEWQPDWSQAPDDADYWLMHPCGSIYSWYTEEPKIIGNKWVVGEYKSYGIFNAPSFNYTGNWRDSLRKRP